jgi:predicted TIM-barrel fold metal-dependent hydrolase
MWNSIKVIDVHGHISRPPQVRQYAAGLMSGRTPGKMNISDEIAEPPFQRHLKDLDDRNIDFQLVGPRPVDQWHWMPFYLQENWARATNDHIAQSIRMHPDRFAGMAHLPQNAEKDTSSCIPELERCVKELGFVGAYLNPDPDGKRSAPGVHEPYWFPLYEKAVELDIPLLIHPCPTEDPRLQVVPANYQMNNVIEEYVATMLYYYGGVFDRYPGLKVVICHCGGALQRFIPTDTQHSHPDKDFSNNVFFDSNGLDPVFLGAAIQQRGVSQMVFGTEVPGSGSAVRPDTGRPGDDLVPTIDALEFLSAGDKKSIFHDNPLKVFTKVKALV